MATTPHAMSVHNGQSSPGSQPATPTGTVWTGLGAAQAKGRACVICTATLRRPVAVMVGRGATGSPVFACPGVCATRATALATSRTQNRRADGGERR